MSIATTVFTSLPARPKPACARGRTLLPEVWARPGRPDFENACTSSVPWAYPARESPDHPGARPQIPNARRIPEATVARLPLYYRALLDIADQEVGTVSSERLAQLAGVNAAKVRKDLSYLGSYGTRGVGYDVEHLLGEISAELGLTHDWPVAIVGLGNLGQALANYRGFGARGFRIVALVDSDPAKLGRTVAGLSIDPLEALDAIVRKRGVAIGIIATPAHAAQGVADRLVEAGVTSILNFAPGVVTVPTGVALRKVDLAIELQILSFYRQHPQGVPAGRGQIEGAGVPAS